MAEKKEKQYVSDNARLMEEWDWEKNADFDPTKLTLGSEKKVWWKCSKGHEWQSIIASRNSGCGCPYCSNNKVLKGYNDLQTINPVVAKEWNYEKNNGLTPSEVMSNSHKKVWWKCSIGHEWQASIAHRNNGRGCPFCIGKKVIMGYNDFQTNFPLLAEEWDFDKNKELSPSDVMVKSNKKVWWKCKNGHSYSSVIAKRTEGQGCPICSGKKLLSGYNDLSTTHPDLIKEWDFEKNKNINPSKVGKSSREKVWWLCKRGHSWNAAIYSRVEGVGCPICAKETQSSYPEKALYFYIQKIFPDAVSGYKGKEMKSLELDIFIPSYKVAVEYDGERWHKNPKKDNDKDLLCKDVGIKLIRVREPKCPPITSGYSTVVKTESKNKGLDETIHKVLEKLCFITGVECSLQVDILKDNVAILELLNSSEKENNLEVNCPELIHEWDYEKNGSLLPCNVTTGSDKKVWWKCEKGHSYSSSVSQKVRGRGCPICAGKIVLKGYNDFESRFPQLLNEWDYEKNKISPSEIAYGSDKKVWWKCEIGHSYEQSINNRHAGNSCPFCSNRKVLKGYNDLETINPSLSKEWNYQKNKNLTPADVVPNSGKNVWWKCENGHEWIARIADRTAGRGCPECAKEKRKNKERA